MSESLMIDVRGFCLGLLNRKIVSFQLFTGGCVIEPKNCLQPIVKCLPEKDRKFAQAERSQCGNVSGTHVTPAR
jgi:hypothetical protein